MAKRLWQEVERPDWAQQQAQRLDEAHFAQKSIHSAWWEQEKERQRTWWQEWADSWAWHGDRWTWVGDGGGWWSTEPAAQTPEPTARSRHNVAASSSWEEDKDPGQMTIDHVSEEPKYPRKGMNPPRCQPKRHCKMILGRPVMVPMCFKTNLRAIV